MEWYWWAAIGVIAIGAFTTWYLGKVRECARDDLPGVVFDAPLAIRQVSEGTLDGLPDDERYYAISFIQQCNRARLLGASPLDKDEVLATLGSLAAEHGVRPRNVRPSPLDSIAGSYTVKGRHHKHTEYLMVFSHHEIGAAAEARDMMSAWGMELPTT